MLEGVRASLDRFRVRMDELLLRAHAARDRRDRDGTRTARRVRARRRALAADHRVRHRQGQRAAPLERRVDLPRQRHRLPPAQDRARVRPRHRRLGRRPPRAHRAHEGGLAGTGREPRRIRGRADAAGEPHRGRRARDDVEARRQRSRPWTTSSTTSVWTPRAGSWRRAVTTRRSTWTSSSLAASPRTTPSTTSSTRTRASRRSFARRARSAWSRRSPPTCAPAQSSFHPSARALVEAAARAARRDPRRRRAPRAAPDHHLRDRDVAGLLSVLPRLPCGGRCRGGRRRGRAYRHRGAHEARAGAVARPARGRGAGADVAAATRAARARTCGRACRRADGDREVVGVARAGRVELRDHAAEELPLAGQGASARVACQGPPCASPHDHRRRSRLAERPAGPMDDGARAIPVPRG